MAHNVKCPLCSKTFDRDAEEYVLVKTRRYAHASCALRAAANGAKINTEVINPLDNVVCIYCGEPMHRKNTPDCILISEGKYAHQHCVELESKREKTDKEKLEDYIKELFQTDYVNAKIQRQITMFIQKFNYTHKGIHMALRYFYGVKENSLDKSNGGIGIVPYIYDEAYRYYYSIWEAKQKNEPIMAKIENYTPKVEEITIANPERKVLLKTYFNFLNEGM